MLAEEVRWSLRPDTKDIYDGGETDAGAVMADDMATLARDLEPECLALSSDGKTVYVSLQEACTIDIADMGGSVKESAVVTDAVTRTWQMTPSLHASRSDGLTGAATLPTSSMTASKIYTMGGRSFSVISTKTWETVYS